ncbi:MAG TPA: helix-turn-helix transcriptional regulator [Puia sp.]|uniref:helix-turn-helix transcriptional regulator n=1 Tax=Puia sp. TaxID=2045100 RepID=UPI002BB9DF68|nr:helix-turn-helix transcriptional regulator [Puia sp.]HVU95922.1 helix-turn-helix transcriptional regulator [Puia sp.]
MVMQSFKLENYEKWLEEFAALLNTPVKDHLLVLPPHVGEGTILAHTMSPNLSYAVMNFRLNSDLEIYREPDGAKGFSLSFNQVEVNKEVWLKDDQPVAADKGSLRNDIFLSDTREPLHVKIPAGSTVKRLMIFATHELASRYLSTELLEKLEAFARANSLSDNPYFVSLPHRETLKELFEMKENDPLSQIRRLSRIIHLTEKFLHSFLRQEQASLPRAIKKNDLESMQHIEQILSSRLEGFPSLESLAHEVFMSTSKLKNLFKQIYGYTLYDYYNKNRLQRAKEMLITGQCSIKQAGSEIGFSNLSHFAKAFKKEFGILPRDLVRHK